MNGQADSSRSLDRDSKAAPRAATEVENKLKEAQSRLMEADGRLRSAGAVGGRTAGERIDTAVTKVSAEAKARMPAKPVAENIPENVAGMLCYLFGWVGGLVFLLIDRRPFVRFHAAQSVALFATLSIVLLALGGFFLGALLPSMAGVLLAVRRIVELGWLVATVLLMLKASSGERYRVAGAAEYGDRAAGDGR